MTQPPILPYKTPEPIPTNTPKKFIGRMALGAALGIAAMIAGALLANITNWVILFWLPPALALAFAITIALRQRRYGYVTGVILAPFFAGVAIILLLFAICGGMAFTGIR